VRSRERKKSRPNIAAARDLLPASSGGRGKCQRSVMDSPNQPLAAGGPVKVPRCNSAVPLRARDAGTIRCGLSLYGTDPSPPVGRIFERLGERGTQRRGTARRFVMTQASCANGRPPGHPRVMLGSANLPAVGTAHSCSWWTCCGVKTAAQPSGPADQVWLPPQGAGEVRRKKNSCR